MQENRPSSSFARSLVYAATLPDRVLMKTQYDKGYQHMVGCIGILVLSTVSLLYYLYLGEGWRTQGRDLETPWLPQ